MTRTSTGFKAGVAAVVTLAAASFSISSLDAKPQVDGPASEPKASSVEANEIASYFDGSVVIKSYPVDQLSNRVPMVFEITASSPEQAGRYTFQQTNVAGRPHSTQAVNVDVEEGQTAVVRMTVIFGDYGSQAQLSLSRSSDGETVRTSLKRVLPSAG